MSSLRHCLAKMGLEKHEEAILRGAVKELQGDGYEAQKAAEQAVSDYIASLEQERADILKQVDDQSEAKAKADEAAKPKPLYASRPVTNAADIVAWAKSQGFASTLKPEDMHVTVAYSQTPMDGSTVGKTDKAVSVAKGKRSVETLGDGGAVVLKFTSADLSARWQHYRDKGASWDYPSYQPHITITYDQGDVDLSKVVPYAGPIRMGAEKQEVLDPDAKDKVVEKPTGATKPAKGETPEDKLSISTEERADNLKRWMGDSKVVDAAGKPKVVYHGAGRPDRIGKKFKGNRATSGPMPYFTDDPAIASSYAQGKQDTSLNGDELGYDQWFTFKQKGARAPQSVTRMWWDLTPEQRTAFNEAMRNEVHQDDENNIVKGDRGLATEGTFDMYLREQRNNGIGAAVELWLNSGALFNDEGKFLDVLRLGGIDTKAIDFVEQNSTMPAVLPVYLRITNPLDTHAIPAKVIAALESAVQRKRAPKQAGGDSWDKGNQDPRAWVRLLKEDEATGKNSYAWTSIPDVVTKTLASLGYDGIFDRGGKGGGVEHTVYIPFRPDQVKSATGNKGTFSPNTDDITLKIAEEGSHAQATAIPLSDAEIEKAVEGIQSRFRDRFGRPDYVLRAVQPGTSGDLGLAAKSRKLASDVASKLFGVRMVWVQQTERLFNALYSPQHPDTVFMDTAERKPLLAMTGHELLHSLKRARPDLYAELEKALLPFIRNEQRYRDILNERYKKKGAKALSEESLREELIADMVGDRFLDPAFWRELANQEPSRFKKFAKAIIEWLDEMIGEVKEAFGTSDYLTDLKRARTIIANAMRQYSAGEVSASVANESLSATGAGPLWYSALERAIVGINTKAMQAADWLTNLTALTKRGVKADEIEWSGIRDWLTATGGKVTKDQVLEYLRGNGVQVTETTLEATTKLRKKWSTNSPSDVDHYDVLNQHGDVLFNGPEREADDFIDKFPTEGETRYAQHTLPGGKNYRELLLTLPVKERAAAPKPVPLTELPEGYEVIVDNSQPADQRWGVKPPSHVHARPAFGRWGSEEEAVAKAIEMLNEKRRIEAMRDADEAADRADFKSGHFDQANILAHIRFNERTDADGKSVLFIEEIQSDWAQKGKRAGFAAPQYFVRNKTSGNVWPPYDSREAAEQALNGIQHTSPRLQLEIHERKNPGIPAAPFVGKTESWVALALKRMIRYAAENGFDRVAWTTGEQQADRYDLSKHIDRIHYEPTEDGNYEVIAFKIGSTDDSTGSEVFHEDEIDLKRVEEVLGKEIAQKIKNSEGAQIGGSYRSWRELKGIDLKVGGEGMRAFYDKIVPNVANDVLKKLGGGRVADGQIADMGGNVQQWTRTDTGQMTTNQAVATNWNNNRLPVVATFEGKAQPGIDITPALRDSALGGMPMFSMAEDMLSISDEKKTEIPEFAKNLPPEQQAALRKAGLIHDTPTLAGRIRELGKGFRGKFVQGMVDQFRPLKDLDEKAYMLARLSAGSDATLEALLLYGKPFLDADGAVNVDLNADADGGFLHAMQNLQGEHDRFFAWVAGQRAAQLKAQGRENLLTDTDITFLHTLNQGKMPDASPREQKYQAALARLRTFNKATLDIAEQSGLIDGESRDLWESQFYVPFYRAIEGDATGPMTIKGGLVNQYAFKKLKGGTEGLNDLFKNTLMNWSHLLSAAAKNRAAKASIEAATSIGGTVEATQEAIRSMAKSIGSKAVSFVDKGTRRWFLIEDPRILDAITSLEWGGFGPVMKPFQLFKRWLTFGVTVSPVFKVRNLLRDTIAAIGTSKVGFNPLANVIQGWKATHKGGQTYASMLAGGGMFRFGTLNEGDRAQHVKRLVEAGIKDVDVLDTKEKIAVFATKFWDAYQELGDRSENINRAALYEQLRKKGMSHLEASYWARDLLDFSLQGRWAAVRFLTQVVPFMNARLQGLYKLGRAAKEDKVRFAVVAGAVAMASIALMLAYEDDDDWKKREDWDRDNYWWFKIGGLAMRIPKPFEIGAIGTLAERTLELALNKEMTPKRFRQRLGDMFANTFAMSPVPQLVKPLVDIYANQDSFTGRTIESAGMERLEKADRKTAATSEAARLLGQLGLPDPLQLLQGRYEGLSPVQIDHLMRGYFGSMAVGTNMMVDAMFRPLLGQPERPAKGLKDIPLIGAFFEELPTQQSRYVSELYSLSADYEQALASYRDAVKRGDTTRAAQIKADEGDKFEKAAAFTHVQAAMAKINLMIRRIEQDETLTPTQKRNKISELKDQQDRIARRVTAVQ